MHYDFSDLNQLRQFDQDCNDAVQQCPQMKHHVPVMQAYNTTFVAFVFQKWHNNSTLWHSGYHECLSERAKETFNRYALLKYGVVIDVMTRQKWEPGK